MTLAHARRRLGVLVVLALVAACHPRSDEHWLGSVQQVAPGVEFYRTADDSLVQGAGPIAVFLIRLDPARARLSSVLANDEVADVESVIDIARRHNALAAINGGFFNGTNGDPLGVLKVSGELVSDASQSKGAVVIEAPPDSATALTFDRLSVKMTMTFMGADTGWQVPIDGVDTTRERGKLMLYTPAYYAHTDTAPTGTEWVLDGRPLRVTEVRVRAGHTAIPPDGAVISYGGLTLPEALASLDVGMAVGFHTIWQTERGLSPARLDAADHIVSGAGLLRRGGHVVDDWTDEGLSTDAFTAARHPRTLIGLDAWGFIWLVAVDGRQPDYSIGMHFSDLQRLADRLGLTDALNLDGGGSTTMVVAGQVVNRPSDPLGARPVGDAILVTPP
jgi:exopolysaccharide biosynthesis protein